MSEQQPTVPSDQVKWGDSLDVLGEERKQELAQRLWGWQPEAIYDDLHGPFVNEHLNGLEVFWLAICAIAGSDGDISKVEQLLRKAENDRVVRYALSVSKLVLVGANLRGAQLQHAQLHDAQLQHADLSSAQLTGANLLSAQLTGTTLTDAHLVGVDLRSASLDKQTRLGGAVLSDVRLDGVIFDNTDLGYVDWSLVPCLQDERFARQRRFQEDFWDHYRPGMRKNRKVHKDEYQAAVRAYRLLAVAVNAKGLTEERDRYTYRASIMQRKAYWYAGWRTRGKWFNSGLLAVVAGYGYRLWHIAATYLAIVTFFAAGYLISGLLSGHLSLSVQSVFNALQISLNAIHGRVFFVQFGLDTLQSWLATIESILGIGIEGVFVAMLIQRFFSK
jgi:hypothetical protein